MQLTSKLLRSTWFKLKLGKLGCIVAEKILLVYASSITILLIGMVASSPIIDLGVMWMYRFASLPLDVEPFYQVARYFINEYSHENYRKWKRYAALGFTVWALIHLLAIRITNVVLTKWLFEWLIIEMLGDYYDNYEPTPRVVIEKVSMIEEYIK